MMKVTKTTMSMMMNNKHEVNKKAVMLQRKLKSGKWGKAFEVEMIGCEHAAEDVLTRMTKNNPQNEYRIAE